MAKERHPTDYYATPREIAFWAVDRCIELRKQFRCEMDPKKITMMEPGCGPIAPFASRAASLGIESYGIDINDIHMTHPIINRPNLNTIGRSNFMNTRRIVKDHFFDIIATNPPFKEGTAFIEKALEYLAPDGVMAILQKMSFQASAGRFEFWKKFPPAYTEILATKRPSFAHGKTDNQEYCIFVWVGSEIAAKRRKKYGVQTLTRWHDNKSWIDRLANEWDR